MCHASNKKLQTTSDGRNETTKSRKKFKRLEYRKYLNILEVDTIK